MEIIGKSPVPAPILIIGKLALFGSAFFFIFKLFYPEAMLHDAPPTRALGVMLYLVGVAVMSIAIAQLGRSTAVGFPERSTELKTHGLYRFSRNPIYTGAYIMCAGSCLFAIHWANLLLFLLAVAIHSRIIRREEEFLDRRFGEVWREYRSHVPRYIGIPGRSAHLPGR